MTDLIWSQLLKTRFVATAVISSFIGLPCLAESECVFPIQQWGLESLSPNIESLGLSSLEEAQLSREFAEGGATMNDYGFEQIPRDPVNRFNSVAKSIGRVDLWLKQDGLECMAVCTGWMISENHLVTSRHCTGYPTASLEKARVLFGFDGDTAGAKFYDLKVEPIETSDGVAREDLDYVVFEVINGEKSGLQPLEISTESIRGSQSLAIIGHPLGIPKQLVRMDCSTANIRPIDQINIRHTCSTLKGMSGSPILDESTGSVVGMHTRGGRINGYTFNTGTYIVGLLEASKIAWSGISPNTLPAVSLSQPVEPDPTKVVEHLLTASVFEGAIFEQKSFDQSLTEINSLLSDENCNLQYAQSGDIAQISAKVSSGVVRSSSDYKSVLRAPGVVKFVPELKWCGRVFGYNIQECAATGSSIVLFAKENYAYALLHGLGHLAGLKHSNDLENFMSLQVRSSGKPSVDAAQCVALRQFAFLQTSVLKPK